MVRALSLTSTEPEEEQDPFLPARSPEETFSDVLPLKPTEPFSPGHHNPGADEISRQHARIRVYFAETPEPELRLYSAATRLTIALLGGERALGRPNLGRPRPGAPRFVVKFLSSALGDCGTLSDRFRCIYGASGAWRTDAENAILNLLLA